MDSNFLSIHRMKIGDDTANSISTDCTLLWFSSPIRNPEFTAEIQQKGALWQETAGLTAALQETVI